MVLLPEVGFTLNAVARPIIWPWAKELGGAQKRGRRAVKLGEVLYG